MNKIELIKKLQQIKRFADECLRELNIGKSKAKASNVAVKTITKSNYLIEIINKIKNCEKNEKIESQILDKSSQEGKILLPFYICYKYFPNQRLTTGNVEKITSDLGVKIKVYNISKAIKKSLWKYLDGHSPRKKGKIILYKLNQRGLQHFESLLNAEKDK